MSRNLTTQHVNAYKNGVFKTLFKGIKEDPELSFEIRTNNRAMVYYHKDKILTTTFDSKGNPKVSMLDSKYYRENKKPSIDIENIGNLRSLRLIREYFRQAKRLVYFYKKGDEFVVQQNIAMGNHSFNKKYLVVDMEWQFPQSEIEYEKRISKTRIDLVVVDTEKNENGNNVIYLAELKVGTGAKDGKSGIIDHVNKTFKIIQEEKACDSLVEDVESIIKNKIELGLFSDGPKEFHFGEKPKMMLISVFRGEQEKQELKKEVQKALNQARKIGMEEPKSIFYNALIELKG